MLNTASYPVSDGTTVEFEVDPGLNGDGYNQASVASAISDRLLSLDAALDPIVAMLDRMATRFAASAGKPASVDLAVSLKIGAEGQFIVAKGSAEGNITITLKYNGS